MSRDQKGAEFLAKRYPGLARQRTVQRSLAAEDDSKNPIAAIQAYLERLHAIIDPSHHEEDFDKKQRNISLLKKMLFDRYVIKPENIPDSYWRAQMRMMRNRGELGDWQALTEDQKLEYKNNHYSRVVEDQRVSLEEWVDYLTSERSSFLPDYLKYWIFVGMLGLERYKKPVMDTEGKTIEPGRLPGRAKGARQSSVKMFPEVNEKGLEFIASAFGQQMKGQDIYWGYEQKIPEEDKQIFCNALSSKDFRLLYALVQEHIPPITDEEMRVTTGDGCRWVTYSRQLRSTGQDISTALAGKGTGWCIVGSEIAQKYLDYGEKLHVYFTPDKDGNSANPRIVIVEEPDRVTEVRGIGWEEDIDRCMKKTDVIAKKLEELPGGDRFLATEEDMKFLTYIDHKMSAREDLTREELEFLYCVHRPINFFGQKPDPRIEELRAQRELRKDISVILACKPSQVAYTMDEIHPDTKIYVGPLMPGIFGMIQTYNIENIYISYPEVKKEIVKIKVGGKTQQKIQADIDVSSCRTNPATKGMIQNPKFMTLSEEKELKLVLLTVAELQISEPYTTNKIYKRAKQLGLQLCPPELGPAYALWCENHPLTEASYYIGMKQIPGLDSDPSVFRILIEIGKLSLVDYWAEPRHEWSRGDKFVFKLG